MKKEFKTTEEIKAALSKVADMLEQEVFTHGSKKSFYQNDFVGKYNFNQEISAASNYDCGTVACIGGWCWLLANEKPIQETDTNVKYRQAAVDRASHFVWGHNDSDRAEGLHELFYPPFEHIDGLEDVLFDDVTPQQAAKAIRNYIESDNPDWEKVMAKCDQ